jgi:hypothetical protein
MINKINAERNPIMLPVTGRKVNQILELYEVTKLKRFSSDYGTLDYLLFSGEENVSNHLLVNDSKRFEDYSDAKRVIFQESEKPASSVDNLVLLRNPARGYGDRKVLRE